MVDQTNLYAQQHFEERSEVSHRPCLNYWKKIIIHQQKSYNFCSGKNNLNNPQMGAKTFSLADSKTGYTYN